MTKKPFNDNWEFTPAWTEEFGRGDKGEYEEVRLPHTVKELPLHYIDTDSYQLISGYRKCFDLPAETEASTRYFLKFGAAGHIATVYVNGMELLTHKNGYTEFEVEFTEAAKPGEENLVAVKLDSTENPEIPPFGYVIDYLTYGGLYRPVSLITTGPDRIDDLFVYTPELDRAVVKATVSTGSDSHASGSTYSDSPASLIRYTVYTKEGKKVSSAEGRPGEEVSIRCFGVKPWDTEHPVLYTLKAELITGAEMQASAKIPASSKTLADTKNQIDSNISDGTKSSANIADISETRFGFRTAEFRSDGFYLNGRRIYLRGLNRHQSFPYVGYAAPRSMQYEDVRIAKYELGLNAIRTSHYPQGQDFIDACDEAGMLVFTEIPGWQHIGNRAWQDQAVKNVEEMILQYRNHPSIILWGVRINESLDDDRFYTETNRLAHELDPSRQTSGVRYLEKSNLLEDVYAFNDFSHTGDNPGAKPKSEVTTDEAKAFLISEHNGHMFPTKSYDNWERRQEHALRHARVLNDSLTDGVHAGCFGWCMFDYPTHRDFGSGDRMCYHGVMDAFRNPKTAAALYSSQQDETPVLEISSSMDIGDYPGGAIGTIWAFTNCDEVRLYTRDSRSPGFRFVGTYKERPYTNLWHSPIPIPDPVDHSWGGKAAEWRFEGIKDGQVQVTRVIAGSGGLSIEAVPSTQTLIEGDTYDMAAVRIRIIDRDGNICPFAQLPISLRLDGDAELIGPDTVTAEGGMCGTYIRTTGCSGAAELTISSPGLESHTIKFSIQKK